ncbi:DUF6286 domain-containing protein [Streptomyces sp. NBC_01264]|uniref:DUF6286 domain-containing protein n=1 Tax=Streptomyces sp. NBC_01264 TaxID=2903804 RepID=UPI00225860A5|nr:DUF6286 domain-containing protein [Streptomyces sp. NBC_01264]MCX4777527.1 DUF6286 domain-containing protein [Streptomyces sp. NBC_01264]
MSARFRSPRRLPAAVGACAVLGVAGLFLYELAAVRAHRPGMRWRDELSSALERHTPADPGVLIGGAALALAGAALLLYALTPGLRGILPMASGHPEVRGGLERKAAAQVLRDRVMEVSGVRSARVSVGRSRIGVRAVSHFRELDDVRADLDAVLSVGVAELGLARELRPRVRVNRR